MQFSKQDIPILIIVHTNMDGVSITEKECRAMLPQEVQNNSIEFMDLKMTSYKRDKFYDIPFDTLVAEQQRKFKTLIEPAIQRNPNAIIAYFGLATIPAAFHLGFLLNGYNNIWVYQQHHRTKEWYRETLDAEKNFKLLPIDFPTKVEKGKGDVMIRVGTSYRIEPQDTYEVLTDPIYEFDIALKAAHYDSIANPAQLATIVDTFQKVLTSIANYLPKRDKIHLFLSTSAGVPFALGTKINPTIFAQVQTYQFANDRTPKYKKAILIQNGVDDFQECTPAEVEIAQKIRTTWEKQLSTQIHAFVANLANNNWNWLEQIKGERVRQTIKTDWFSLPSIKETLIEDKIDLEPFKEGNGFQYEHSTSLWKLADSFLVRVDKRFKNKNNIEVSQAGRLFLFHESLHYAAKGHRFTEDIATGIGRFPKVIEKADYQADVWAILHEYKYAAIYERDKISNLKIFFLNAIDTAVETMWSFLDDGKNLNRIQLRSVNRFLNWYWQWVRIEQLKDKITFEAITDILMEQPVIELAGAEQQLEAEKIFMKLSNNTVSPHQIALFYKNKVSRLQPVKMNDLIDGFITLNGEKIKTVLRNFYVTVTG